MIIIRHTNARPISMESGVENRATLNALLIAGSTPYNCITVAMCGVQEAVEIFAWQLHPPFIEHDTGRNSPGSSVNLNSSPFSLLLPANTPVTRSNGAE